LLVSIPGNGAMLTYSFDDGHISNYTAAFPILKSYGQVGTVNIVSNWAVSGYLNRINPTQLLEMQGSGWEICSHSKTHPRFSKIPQTYNVELLTGWNKAPGTNSTYQTGYTYGQLPFVLQDESILKKKSSIEEVNNTPGSFYFDSVNEWVYVHTTDSNDPTIYDMRSDSV